MNNELIANCFGFDWDSGNFYKNQAKHNVDPFECEQVFFNDPLLIYEDVKHSMLEKRYYLLGRTNSYRKLFIVFTIRDELIRVISARDMSKKEQKIYEES